MRRRRRGGEGNIIINTLITPDLAMPVIRWRQAADDVYVATINEEFAGFISVTAAGYELRGPHADELGTHASKDAAQQALSAALLP